MKYQIKDYVLVFFIAATSALTGYVGGVYSTAASYMAAPLVVHEWAKDMQEKSLGTGG